MLLFSQVCVRAINGSSLMVSHRVFGCPQMMSVTDRFDEDNFLICLKDSSPTAGGAFPGSASRTSFTLTSRQIICHPLPILSFRTVWNRRVSINSQSVMHFSFCSKHKWWVCISCTLRVNGHTLHGNCYLPKNISVYYNGDSAAGDFLFLWNVCRYVQHWVIAHRILIFLSQWIFLAVVFWAYFFCVKRRSY